MFLIIDEDREIKSVSKNAYKVEFNENDMEYHKSTDINRYNAIFDEDNNIIYPRSLGYTVEEFLGELPELPEGATSYSYFTYDGYGGFEKSPSAIDFEKSRELAEKQKAIEDARATGIQDAIEYLLMKVADLEGRL